MSRVYLHYRPVNQAEEYRVVEMTYDGNAYTASIPVETIDPAYPLQYLFELQEADGRAWWYPGLAPDLANQPYFIIV